MIGMMDGDTWEFFNDPSYFYGEFSVAYTILETNPDGIQNTVVERETHKAVPCTRKHFELQGLDQYLE